MKLDFFVLLTLFQQVSIILTEKKELLIFFIVSITFLSRKKDEIQKYHA